ncbi:UNVERIFIED_CONTAM: hypothetical protein Sangu_2159300 [Sesamum angustifolium]|uniref:Uncharacterized protein n=1 Tax=Sesamum angustifolium TaxID=2727405 RepID=A0AAW2LEA6_9LAMI
MAFKVVRILVEMVGCWRRRSAKKRSGGFVGGLCKVDVGRRDRNIGDLPRVRGMRPPFLAWVRRGGDVTFLPHIGCSSSRSVWGDLPLYLEGYSPNHIATTMSLPKCHSFA